MPSTPDLNAVKARVAAASPAPWRVLYETCECEGNYPCGYGDYWNAIHGPIHHLDTGSPDCIWMVEPDALFIAHAREDIPVLIARIEHLEGELRRIKKTAHEGFCGLGRNAGFDACMVVLGITAAALNEA